MIAFRKVEHIMDTLIPLWPVKYQHVLMIQNARTHLLRGHSARNGLIRIHRSRSYGAHLISIALRIIQIDISIKYMKLIVRQHAKPPIHVPRTLNVDIM